MPLEIKDAILDNIPAIASFNSANCSGINNPARLASSATAYNKPGTSVYLEIVKIPSFIDAPNFSAICAKVSLLVLVDLSNASSK